MKIISESTYRHYFDLEGDYISVDIMDTAGKVSKQPIVTKLLII